jgi:hypothetical protein
MSLPKFNLSKLRDSVAQQQAVTKKDIANLLLLDRLQAMIKSQKPKERKRESLDDFITIDIMMTKSSKDEYFYLYDSGADSYAGFEINLENIVNNFLFDENKYFEEYHDYETKEYFGKEDKYELEIVDNFYDAPILSLTIKIPLKKAIKRLKEHFESEIDEGDKETALTIYKLVGTQLLENLKSEARDLYHIIEGWDEYRKTAIKKFNENVELIKKETKGWDESSFPLLEEDATEGYGLPLIVGLIVDSIEVY